MPGRGSASSVASRRACPAARILAADLPNARDIFHWLYSLVLTCTGLYRAGPNRGRSGVIPPGARLSPARLSRGRPPLTCDYLRLLETARNSLRLGPGKWPRRGARGAQKTTTPNTRSALKFKPQPLKFSKKKRMSAAHIRKLARFGGKASAGIEGPVCFRGAHAPSRAAGRASRPALETSGNLDASALRISRFSS
jgi:hypothetical protein